MAADVVHAEAGLVDLLDRVLDRGLVIHADIMITLAGVPLVGLNLRAVLAGMETLLADAQMRDWDARVRARALRAEIVEAINV